MLKLISLGCNEMECKLQRNFKIIIGFKTGAGQIVNFFFISNQPKYCLKFTFLLGKYKPNFFHL